MPNRAYKYTILLRNYAVTGWLPAQLHSPFDLIYLAATKNFNRAIQQLNHLTFNNLGINNPGFFIIKMVLLLPIFFI
ncbi:MAG: hypothetical protein WAT16_09895 [Saprospiraceae bacterium]